MVAGVLLCYFRIFKSQGSFNTDSYLHHTFLNWFLNFIVKDPKSSFDPKIVEAVDC